MPLYEISKDSLSAIEPLPLAEAGVSERGDLQRLLRDQVEIICPNTLVIGEEFSDWEDSRRRIDLLGIDVDGTLVVIELKRTEDGGHMELQAVRYAAMISALTFDRLVEIYSDYLKGRNLLRDPFKDVLDHLGWDSPDEGEIGNQVRIVLASANFSKEITTTVLWLNSQGLDITCIRLAGHRYSGKILLDVQQVIPLPEADEYTVKLKEKAQKSRSRKGQRDPSKFSLTLGSDSKTYAPQSKNRAIFTVVQHLIQLGVPPNEIQAALPPKQRSRFFELEGDILSEEEFGEAAVTKSQTEQRSFNPNGWFIKDDDLIRIGGNTFAFSSQWGQWTERCIQFLAEAFPAAMIHYEKHS